MMSPPDPTPERIPAALALEERVARLERATEHAPYQGRIRALNEIRDALERPTAPKLRTRAEVDAEIVTLVRAYMDERYRTDRHDQAKLAVMWQQTAELTAEPTAPEGVTYAPGWNPNRAKERNE